MKALSLFTGIMGIDLACEWAGIETVAMCERDPFCQKVIRKHKPNIPLYDDICTLTKERLERDGIGTIDLIHGGFPCQPFSLAGKQGGSSDERHLWPEMFRVIHEVRPRWVVGENVTNFKNMELDNSLSDLERIGYKTQSFIIPACAVDAPHRRSRCFIVAHAESQQSTSENEREFSEKKQKQLRRRTFEALPRSTWEIREPGVCGVDDGFPDRVDRVRSLGNAVVPQQIYPIFEAIMQIEKNGQFEYGNT